ncbi:hypothetical protein L249_8236, partial [Ophiocordyceps polyrhachis-furcata BCC 54312]
MDTRCMSGRRDWSSRGSSRSRVGDGWMIGESWGATTLPRIAERRLVSESCLPSGPGPVSLRLSVSVSVSVSQSLRVERRGPKGGGAKAMFWVRMGARVGGWSESGLGQPKAEVEPFSPLRRGGLLQKNLSGVERDEVDLLS